MGVLARTPDVLEVAAVVADRGNVNSLSDAGVAAAAARAAAEGAYENVLINLPGLADEAQRNSLAAEAAEIFSRVRDRAAQISDGVQKRLLEELSS
jgi:glutamate formiminotransferase/formiminotetrahydrofolate cyclodeaminase